MAGRIYETAIRISAAIAKGFTGDTKAASAAIKTLGTETKKLTQTRDAAVAFGKLTTAVAAAKDKFDKASAAEKALAAAAKAAGKPTEDLKEKLKAAHLEAAAAGRELKRTQSALDRAGRSLVKAGVDTAQLTKEQQRLEQQLARTSLRLSSMKAAEAARERLVGKRQAADPILGNLKNPLNASLPESAAKLRDRLGSLARDGFLLVGGAAAAAAVPLQKYMAFQKAMAESSTLVADESKMPELAKQVRALSAEFGSNHIETAGALWTILSAGVQDTAKATDVLRSSLKLAVGGSTDAKTAAIGIASAVNAFKEQALSAADAADILFTASAIGMASPEAMAQSLGRVAPIAAEVGVSFDQVGGAIGALTTVMPSTDEAVTELSALLTGVIKPTKQAREEAKRLGIDFTSTAVKTKGLTKFIQELAANKKFTADSAAKLFGRVEALRAVMFLGKDGAATLNDAMEQMSHHAGSVDTAFVKMSRTLDFQWKQAKTKAEDVAITLGSALAPAAQRALSKISKWVTENQDKIQAWADKTATWIENKAIPAIQKAVPEFLRLAERIVYLVEKGASLVGGFGNLAIVIGALRLAPLAFSIGQVGFALGRATAALVKYIARAWAAKAASDALAKSGGGAGGGVATGGTPAGAGGAAGTVSKLVPAIGAGAIAAEALDSADKNEGNKAVMMVAGGLLGGMLGGPLGAGLGVAAGLALEDKIEAWRKGKSGAGAGAAGPVRSGVIPLDAYQRPPVPGATAPGEGKVIPFPTTAASQAGPNVVVNMNAPPASKADYEKQIDAAMARAKQEALAAFDERQKDERRRSYK